MPMFPPGRYDLPPLVPGSEYDWAFRIKLESTDGSSTIQIPAEAQLIVLTRPITTLVLSSDGDWLRAKIASSASEALAALWAGNAQLNYRVEIRLVDGDWQRLLHGNWRVLR